MQTSLYIYCAVLGVLGMLFHLFAIKLPATRSRAKAANVPFSIKEYFKEDYLAVISSFLTVLIFVLVLDELIGYNPSLLRFVKFLFLFVGYTGSSVLIGIFGRFDKEIQKVVDVKTDKADGK